MNKLYRDFFLHFDIAFIIILVVALTSTLVLIGGQWIHFLFFVIGLVTFAFFEYMTHRFLFHMKPPKNKLMLKAIKRLHYDHHLVPEDLKLLFLPLWYSLPNLLILCGIFYLIFSNVMAMIAFSIGLMIMLLAYEWKHYIAHRPIKPKSKFGRWLKKTHILHHFKNENYWFGVSNPLFDYVFGTIKDEKHIETSATAKYLENR